MTLTDRTSKVGTPNRTFRGEGDRDEEMARLINETAFAKKKAYEAEKILASMHHRTAPKQKYAEK